MPSSDFHVYECGRCGSRDEYPLGPMGEGPSASVPCTNCRAAGRLSPIAGPASAAAVRGNHVQAAVRVAMHTLTADRSTHDMAVVQMATVVAKTVAALDEAGFLVPAIRPASPDAGEIVRLAVSVELARDAEADTDGIAERVLANLREAGVL